MKLPRERCMTTFTGLRFCYYDPQPQSVSLQDIAHHLSLLCRWGGACSQFYSVAQHSVLVSHLCPPALARWGLLHDAAEAYFGDLQGGIKLMLPEYKEMEVRAMQVIAERFGLPWPQPPQLKQFDLLALALEARDLMHQSEVLYDQHGNILKLELPPMVLHAWSPAVAKSRFLVRFGELQ